MLLTIPRRINYRSVQARHLTGLYPLDGISRADGDLISKNNLTFKATRTYTNELGRNSLYFNGSQSALLPSSVPVPAEATWAAWFKTTASGLVEIIGNDTDSGLTGTRVGLSSTAVFFNIYVSGTFHVSISSSAGFNDNRWHHVVATWGNGSSSLYVDAKLIGTVAGNYHGNNANWATAIGCNNHDGNQNTWNFVGNICDVRMYRVALPPSVVRHLYQNPFDIWETVNTDFLFKARRRFNPAWAINANRPVL